VVKEAYLHRACDLTDQLRGMICVFRSDRLESWSQLGLDVCAKTEPFRLQSNLSQLSVANARDQIVPLSVSELYNILIFADRDTLVRDLYRRASSARRT